MEMYWSSIQEVSKKICLVLGVALVVLGMIFSLIIFSLIGRFFKHPDSVPLLQRMLQFGSEEQIIKGNMFGQDFSIAYSNFIGYFILLIICGILLAAAGRIVFALISGGINALSVAAGNQKK